MVKKSVSDTLYGNIRGMVVEIQNVEAFCSDDEDYDWFDVTVMTSDGVTRVIPRALLEIIVDG